MKLFFCLFVEVFIPVDYVKNSAVVTFYTNIMKESDHDKNDNSVTANDWLRNLPIRQLHTHTHNTLVISNNL